LPRSTRQIGAWIEQEFGHVYAGRSGLIALLHRLGLEHVSAEQIRRVPNRIKGFSGGYLRQSLSALILFWSPSNANFVFC